MKNLNIIIGQEIIASDLVEMLGIQFNEYDRIEKGDLINLDNFDGEKGVNVYFEVFNTSDCNYDDNGFCFNPEDAVLRITEMDDI